MFTLTGLELYLQIVHISTDNLQIERTRDAKVKIHNSTLQKAVNSFGNTCSYNSFYLCEHKQILRMK